MTQGMKVLVNRKEHFGNESNPKSWDRLIRVENTGNFYI